MRPSPTLVLAVIVLAGRGVSAQTESQYILTPECFDTLPDHHAHACSGVVYWTSKADPGTLYARLKSALLADSLIPTSHDSSGKSVALAIWPSVRMGAASSTKGPTGSLP
jgi:hypothetical protein